MYTYIKKTKETKKTIRRCRVRGEAENGRISERAGLVEKKGAREMKSEGLEYLLELLENIYGDLDDDSGCYIGREWLSPKRITDLIFKADNEY